VNSHVSTPQLSGIRYGAAYYAEYQVTPRLSEDLDLMVAAGFTVIRVGESVWSTWEPQDGVFDLEWLLPVLDGARERGIDVILGTPTYAIPPWLQHKHPELAGQFGTGKPTPWGSRQEVDYSQPLFRSYAERIIRAIVGRYADHPAVVGFQIDNEPGLMAFHNPLAFRGFVERLKKKYKTVDALNREWGLTYWSHRISEWDELWVPDGNASPQYDLAWRRYQAGLTTEFIEWQARIVREYSSDHQFVTTCIAYSRPSLDDTQLAANLDITAANPYYGMQEHLSAAADIRPLTDWSSSGVWGLFGQADRAWSTKQSRFLITETNAQSISRSEHNSPGYPGQLRLAALALVSRGAAMVEYWHWNTLQSGTETYWGGVLPHSGRPGRVYREVSEIGALLSSIGSAFDGFVPDADVAVLYSNASKWAFDFTPPFHTAGGLPEAKVYQTIFDSFYRGVIESGAQARIVHASQLGSDAAAFAAKYPVFMVPAFYVTTDAELEFLANYATAGGHLVLGIRTGYADDEARARVSVAPDKLAEPAGVWYEEYSNLELPLAVTGSAKFTPSAGARATRWIDSLILDGANSLATYDHPEFGAYPALTTRVRGTGRITYVGTVPNRELAADIARWAIPTPTAHSWERSASVTIASGVTATGIRMWFISNWSSNQATAYAPHAVIDAAEGKKFAAGHSFSLEPWASLILVDE
jgi:beta-galactosidase